MVADRSGYQLVWWSVGASVLPAGADHGLPVTRDARRPPTRVEKSLARAWEPTA